MKRPKVSPPDCRTCGLCCIPPFEQEAFADVGPEDIERMGARRARRLVRLADFGFGGAIKTTCDEVRRGPLAGAIVTRCAALRGTPGVRVSCTIYAVRPDVCRNAIKPGDKTCRSLRRERGLV